MVWTKTCWQTGCRQELWGKARQKFRAQRGELRGCIRLLSAQINMAGQWGLSLWWRHLVAGSHVSLALSRRARSVFHSCQSASVPWGEKKANSQGLRLCEKTWLDRGSRCHGGEVVFRHGALFVLISKPVRRLFDVVFGWCPKAPCLC